MPSYEYRDGRMVELPDTILTESGEFPDDVRNTLVVESGVVATTTGRISGTVALRQGATLVARGPVSGTVHVEPDSTATFFDRASGTLNVEPGGTVRIMPGAVALGTMHIEGTLVNEGTRGVQVTGGGSVEDREGSTVRRPDKILDDGSVVYFD